VFRNGFVEIMSDLDLYRLYMSELMCLKEKAETPQDTPHVIMHIK
jgi:hypothetical protein